MEHRSSAGGHRIQPGGGAHPLGEWGEQVDSNILSFRFATHDEEKFKGDFQNTAFLNASVFSMTAADHVAERTTEHLANEDDEYLILTFQVGGMLNLVQDGHRVQLSPGQFSFYRSNKPVLLECYGNYESRSIRIPMDRFSPGSIRPEILGHMAFDGDTGLAPPVYGFLSGLLNTEPSLSTSARTAVANQLVSLVEMMLAELHLPDREVESAVTTALLEQCLEFIEQNLSDATLTPTRVADSAHISTRYLQQIFRQAGLTCAGYIRLRRLERIRTDLGNKDFSLVPIEKILQRWGVQNPSHFGQVFKRMEGCTPTEFRRRAHAPGELNQPPPLKSRP